MKNTLDLNKTKVDEFLDDLSPQDLRQLMQDYSDYERTGVQGDTLLRELSGKIYRKLEGRENGFNAVYMSLIGAAAHKVANLRTIEAEVDIEAADRAWETQRLAEDLANLPDLTDANIDELRALQARAREIFGLDKEPDSAPSP